MAADSVRQRVIKTEDNEEKVEKKVEGEDEERSFNVWAAAAQFLVGLLIVIGSIYSQLDTQPVKPRPIDQERVYILLY